VGASFELGPVDVATTGTVGEPGQRVFYLQFRTPATVVSIRLEKQQVGALADYLSGLLADLPPPDALPDPATLALVEPVDPCGWPAPLASPPTWRPMPWCSSSRRSCPSTRRASPTPWRWPTRAASRPA